MKFNKNKVITAILTGTMAVAMALPTFGAGSKGGSPKEGVKPGKRTNLTKIAEQKGMTLAELQAKREACLKNIAAQKGITVEELKQNRPQCGDKVRTGKKGCPSEAKLAKIAELKGLTIDELKEKFACQK